MPQPDDAHALKADPILRHKYGGQLEAAAESFLVGVFERASTPGSLELSLPPGLIGAAMHILNRTAWQQPSDEQIKAAMYLSQGPRPAPPQAQREA